MQLFGETLATGTLFFLVAAVGLALFFEAINGFHDTANAVATVIYTHSLKPTYAVIWSGFWNFMGVLTSSGAVAFGIVALLPVELVLTVGSGPSYAMVFSLLISAIIWNFGTWFIGLPASSSHSLIGAILGVGLANSLLSSSHNWREGVNWDQVKSVFTSLLVSPIVGFIGAGALLLLLKTLLARQQKLFEPANAKVPPPWWVRGLLILTCTGVSFAHGSNDGQKGMGLLMLILVGILPGIYSLNMGTNAQTIAQIVSSSQAAMVVLDQKAQGRSLNDQQASSELSNFLKNTGKVSDNTFVALAEKNRRITDEISGKDSFKKLSIQQRSGVRRDMYLVSSSIDKLNKQKKFTDANQQKALVDYSSKLGKETKFIPTWVKAAVAFALGIGTMVGWKRIVVTVGEKIGKEHLSYGQGASAELVAMTTIFAADHYGLPVSTTHVLSSGIAGTMAANGSGLQGSTLRNIALAWVLTLPACMLLGAGFFSASLYALFKFGLGIS